MVLLAVQPVCYLCPESRCLCSALPVPELVSSDGQDLLAARPWLSQAVRLAHGWRQFVRRPPLAAPAPVPPPPEASAVAAGVVGAVVGGARLQWTPHWVLAGGGRSVCLRCGLTARARDPARLRGTACAAEVARLPAAVTAPLLAGAFDGALRAVPPAWRARACLVGWREVPGDSPGPPRAGLETHRAAPPDLYTQVGPLVASFRRQQVAADSIVQDGSGDPKLVLEPD